MSFHKFDNSDPVEVYNTWFKDHDEHLKPKEKDARMVWIEQELEKLLEEKRQKAAVGAEATSGAHQEL